MNIAYTYSVMPLNIDKPDARLTVENPRLEALKYKYLLVVVQKRDSVLMVCHEDGSYTVTAPGLMSFTFAHAETYQPKTGAMCSCRRGQERDNCPNCEGTGMVIDFAAIRTQRLV
jgi:hypothetical protein